MPVLTSTQSEGFRILAANTRQNPHPHGDQILLEIVEGVDTSLVNTNITAVCAKSHGIGHTSKIDNKMTQGGVSFFPVLSPVGKG